MGLDDGGDFWLEQTGGDLVNCQSKLVGEAVTSSMSLFREEDPSSVANPCFPSHVAEQFLASDWNLFISMGQHVDCNEFAAPSSSIVGVEENEEIRNSGGSFIEQIPSLLCFNSEEISEAISSCALPVNGQAAGAPSPTDVNSSDGHGIGKDCKGKKRKKVSECGPSDSQFPLSRIQAAKAEQRKDLIYKEEVKKESVEHNPGENIKKLSSKQGKGNSPDGDSSSKDDYIHLRAKRGQATNSHSLAERVRRQKISERMRFLQDLVPGCSKITGKAVMLDEIINYIQSLQRQVEFLSMKLATVNPQLNFDVEQILSKDILRSQIGRSDLLGFCPGFSTSHLHYRRQIQGEVMQAEMAIDTSPHSRAVLKGTLLQISPLAQISNAWKDEPQNAMQMGDIPTGRLDARTEPPGSKKT